MSSSSATLSSFSKWEDEIQTLSMARGLTWYIESLCEQRKNSIDSVFKCLTSVPISLIEYGDRLGLYMKCDSSSFVIAASLVETLYEINPDYFCPLSAHKIACTASLLAVKSNQDILFTNSHYAEIFGVTLRELNDLESFFWRLLGFQIRVNPIQFIHVKARLLKIEFSKKEHEAVLEKKRKLRLQRQYEEIRMMEKSDSFSSSFSSSSSSPSSSSSSSWMCVEVDNKTVISVVNFAVGS
eukprot:c13159_g1_i1.p1 GENE.c13159_g1_i1~~c13159_g1_i1.p1  ORF type:complete len:240 (+),score=88.34 c13159_g1_i1:232-951(+)